MATLSLLDVAKLSNSDREVGLINEVVTVAPELNVFNTRIIPGYRYETSIRTGLPTAAFSVVNGGVVPSKSSFRKSSVECMPLSSLVTIDKRATTLSGSLITDLEMEEAANVMKSAAITIGSQIFNGISADASGFTGLKAFIPYTATSGTSAIIVDAAGTTSTTMSSFYAVKMGPQDASLVWGGGTTFRLGDFRDELFAPASGSGSIDGRVAALNAWVGLQLGNVYCAGRIYNLTEDSGKTLTDLKIAALLRKFPTGFKPTAFFANRRDIYQLQLSRTFTNFATGANKLTGGNELVAPWPTEAFGIPIIETDSIGITDALNT